MSVIDTMVVFGECAIGIALILGLASRFAGLAGAVMMGLFFVANWSFATGPINEQLMPSPSWPSPRRSRSSSTP